MIHLDGFGTRSVDKLLKSIEDSKDVKLENFIASLGIPNIGLSAAKTISNYCNGSWNTLYELIEKTSDWTFLDDFGQVMSDSLNSYFNENLADVAYLSMGMRFVAPEMNTNNSLDGLKFCITGSFSRSRDELKAELERRGAKFVSSVSKNLDVLFCGEKAGSKLTKAQQLGVRVADENELMEMLK
jgi:DNA ligase (NAD+)